MYKRFNYYGSESGCPSISAEAEAVVANIEINSGEVCDCEERHRVARIVDGYGGFSSVDGSHGVIDYIIHPLKTSAKSLAFWTGVGNATAVNGPTFSSGIGFELDGINQYIDSGVDLSTLTNFSLNDSLIGTYTYRNDQIIDNADIFGVVESVNNRTQLRQQPQVTHNRFFMQMQTTPVGTGSVDGNNFKDLTTYVMDRYDSSNFRLFKNGITLTSISRASTVIPFGYNLYWGGTNGVGALSASIYTGILSGGIIGKSISFNKVLWNTLIQNNTGAFPSSSYNPVIDTPGLELYLNKRNSTPESWLDQSPNGYNFSQATTTKRPVIGPNAVEFDGSNDSMTKVISNAFGSDSSGILFFSGYRMGTNFETYFASSDNSTNDDKFVIGLDTGGLLAFNSFTTTAVNTIKSTSVVNVDDYFYGYIKSNGSSYELSLNGNIETTLVGGSDDGTWFSDITNRNDMTLGWVNDIVPSFHTAGINKMIYSSGLTAGEILEVDTFMSDPNN